LKLGSTQLASPASGLLTALCPAGAGWAQIIASIAAEPSAEALTALWRRVEERSSLSPSQRASARTTRE